jgi:hypothetical protein
MNEIPDVHERRSLQEVAPVRPTIPQILAAEFENLPYVEPHYKNRKEAEKASEELQASFESLMEWFVKRQQEGLSDVEKWKVEGAFKHQDNPWGAYFMHCYHNSQEKRRVEKQKLQRVKDQLTMEAVK